MIGETKDANDDIDKYKLAFIGSNREKISFNIFRMPLNFLSAIYNGEISLKETEFLQKDLYNEINKLKFDYRPENAEEKEEINRALIHPNDLLKHRDKIIGALRKGTFLSEHLKKSDNAAYDYVLKDVNNFIQKIESMAEKINLSLFEDFFGSPSPADYAKILINTKNLSENKESVAEIENRILDLKETIKEMGEKEKK